MRVWEKGTAGGPCQVGWGGLPGPTPAWCRLRCAAAPRMGRARSGRRTGPYANCMRAHRGAARGPQGPPPEAAAPIRPSKRPPAPPRCCRRQLPQALRLTIPAACGGWVAGARRGCCWRRPCTQACCYWCWGERLHCRRGCGCCNALWRLAPIAAAAAPPSLLQPGEEHLNILPHRGATSYSRLETACRGYTHTCSRSRRMLSDAEFIRWITMMLAYGRKWHPQCACLQAGAGSNAGTAVTKRVRCVAVLLACCSCCEARKRSRARCAKRCVDCVLRDIKIP